MKISKEIIFLPISQLINNSICRGLFPNICKLAQVIPIFKNDSRFFSVNYRPISLSNISKIFEKATHSRLNFFLEQHIITFIHIDYSTNNAIGDNYRKNTKAALMLQKRPSIHQITTPYLKNLITMVL